MRLAQFRDDSCRRSTIVKSSARMAQVFVELADTLVEEFDVAELLQMLTERCVELLQVDAAGIMLADQRGSLQVLASTMNESRSLELFELQIDEGPCRDCYADGQSITNLSLSDAVDRWPRFTPAAVGAGFLATHAMPMRLRRQVVGVLNLFTHEDLPLAAEDLSVGQALADMATIGLLHERNLREKTVLSEQFAERPAHPGAHRAGQGGARGAVGRPGDRGIRQDAQPRPRHRTHPDLRRGRRGGRVPRPAARHRLRPRGACASRARARTFAAEARGRLGCPGPGG